MDSPQLDRDIVRLSDALWPAVTTLGSPAIHELCRRLGTSAEELRAGDFPGGRRAFAEQIAQLGDAELDEVARAFALRCHLMNIAEERQRLRTLRARGERPPDGLAAEIDAIVDAGATAGELRTLFERLLVMPVLTAHPTEARRRSSLDHVARIAGILDELDLSDSARAAERLAAEVLAFHATEDARARRPTPLDEVENSLDVFRRSLLDVTPRIYRTIEDRLAARLGGTWRLPSCFRWGTWVGGDRDGNPNVTAAVTRGAFARQRATILSRYIEDVVVLGRSLSVSALRVGAAAEAGALDELEASLARDREQLPEVAARARPRTHHEPWREKLWYVQARLRATLEHRDEGYVDAEVYLGELEILDRSLRGAGLAAVAEQELRDALRRVDVFGFHLASLDVRQHSAVHDRVVAELLARGGRPGYLELGEAERRRVLGEVLARPITPERAWDGMSADAQGLLETLEVVGRARRELGPRACERYVVSFTREVSDLLEVVFRARAAGLAPGELRPVPLLEQLEDLARAGAIATDILAQDTLRTELGDELEVMLGYSDSGKQVGYVAAGVALRRAQLELAAAAGAAGVTLTVFHGRGGALGRGGGPERDAIRAQPIEAIRGRLRVTEQGETVTARYALPEIAERDVEQTSSRCSPRRASASPSPAPAPTAAPPGPRPRTRPRRPRRRRRARRVRAADRRRGSPRALHRRRDADRGRRAPAARLAPGVAQGRHHAREPARDPVGVLVDAEPPRHPGVVRRRHRDRGARARARRRRRARVRGAVAVLPRAGAQLRAVARALRHRRRRRVRAPRRSRDARGVRPDRRRARPHRRRAARHPRHRHAAGDAPVPRGLGAAPQPAHRRALAHPDRGAAPPPRRRRRARAARPRHLHDDRRHRRRAADRGLTAR